MEFKEEMLTSFIPVVERMIKKEEDHLKYLNETRDKFIKESKRFFSIFSFIYKDGIEMSNKFIAGSKINLHNLKKSIKDYQEYCEKI